MILRRFMEHIKEQNWFAVGLDVIVVILGVYIGIFLGDAANKQSLHESTLDALKVIQSQLQIDLDNVDRIAQYREEKLAEPRAAIELLLKPALDHQRASDLITSMNKRLYTFFPKLSGYNTLEDRGYLAQIDDPNLQLALANLYDEVYTRNTVVANESDSNAFNYDRDYVGIYWDPYNQDFIGDAEIARKRLLNAIGKNLSNSEWLVIFLNETVRPAIVEAMTAIEIYQRKHL